jgi:hypothetical protein
MSEHCPTCRQPIIVTPAGRRLETEPHKLGVLRPDGTRIPAVTAILAAAGGAEPAGHREHVCPRPQQDTLFSGDAA